MTEQFIEMISEAERIHEFDADLYFTLVEKITVSEGRLVVWLLDGLRLNAVSE